MCRSHERLRREASGWIQFATFSAMSQHSTEAGVGIPEWLSDTVANQVRDTSRHRKSIEGHAFIGAFRENVDKLYEISSSVPC